MRLFFIIIFIFFIDFAHSQSIEFGNFCRLNSAGDYSVRTSIVLKNDGTFEYTFTSHLFNDKLNGTFSVKENNLIRLFYDTLAKGDINNKELIEMSPKLFQYKKNRLYEVDEHGKLIKSKRLLSNYRRFYFFGNYSRRKKVYLKRVVALDLCK